MSTAVLQAVAPSASGGPACALRLLDGTLAGRLAGQLRQQRLDRIVVLTRPQWTDACRAAVGNCEVEAPDGLAGALERISELADEDAGPFVLAHAELLMHDELVAGLIRDPRVATGILAAGWSEHSGPGPCHTGIRLSRGRVVAAESAYHRVARGSADFLGVCKVAGRDRGRLASVAGELAEMVDPELPPGWGDELERKVRRCTDHIGQDQTTPVRRRAEHQLETLRDDVVSLTLVGLVRRDVALTSSYRRELFWERPLSREQVREAQRRMAAIDESRVLLDSAVKVKDGFFTTFLVSPYSKFVARWCADRGLTPNQVTTISMAMGLIAAACFALGTRAGLIAGAVLLQLAFTADCVDGQLARYSRQFSKLGAWLDSVFDRGKEYVVYAALALGGVRIGGAPSIWLLASAALALQTVRHHIDFAYAAEQRETVAASVHGPLDDPGEAGVTFWEAMPDELPLPQRGVSDVARLGIRASHAFERTSVLKWMKRIVVLPIGERFALISVTAAVFSARVTFLSLLFWGVVAAAYTVTGRVLRSLT